MDYFTIDDLNQDIPGGSFFIDMVTWRELPGERTKSVFMHLCLWLKHHGSTVPTPDVLLKEMKNSMDAPKKKAGVISAYEKLCEKKVLVKTFDEKGVVYAWNPKYLSQFPR